MSIVYQRTILSNIYDSPKFEDVMCILFSFSIYNICSDIKHISFILISVQRMQVRKNSSNPQDYRLFEKIDFLITLCILFFNMIFIKLLRSLK